MGSSRSGCFHSWSDCSLQVDIACLGSVFLQYGGPLLLAYMENWRKMTQISGWTVQLDSAYKGREKSPWGSPYCLTLKKTANTESVGSLHHPANPAGKWDDHNEGR
jgi:hypothetical protein